MARAKAVWTGVLDVPELDLVIDGGFYSVKRRGRKPLPVVMTHTECQRTVEVSKTAKPEGTEEKGAVEEEGQQEAVPTPLRQQLYCPACRRYVRADEIGRAVRTESFGVVPLSAEELAALQPQEETKRVKVQLVRNADAALATIGTGRRLFCFPKPADVEAYYLLLNVFQKSDRCGFLQDVVVGGRFYVFLLRPIVTVAAVFGRALPLLVVDEFFDTDMLKNPADLGFLPVTPPVSDAAVLEGHLARAKAATREVDPDQCVNPSQRRLKELVLRKVAQRRTL